MYVKKFPLFLLFFLAACTFNTQEQDAPFKFLIDLESSTKIIRALICDNKLDTILETHDSKQLDRLLNNFSPAQMAFEVEVLATTIPLVVVYYYQNAPEDTFLKELDQLAATDPEKIKFVVVNADTLFTLAQEAEVEQFPTILVVKNREIIERTSGKFTIDSIQDLIKNIRNEI